MKKHLKAAFAVILAALMALAAFPAFAVKNSSESEATVSTDKENIFAAKAPNPNEHTKIAPIQPLTQSRYYNFNTNYTLTGNGASDMVAIALAQVGMTGSQLGYSEEWCADFIGDCAILAGETAAIPLYGGVPGLRERIETAGGYYVSVSNAQPGDVCIIDWDGGGHNNHVELVYSANGSSISTVGGNSGDYSSLYTRRVVKHNPLNSGVITCIIRPNYTSSPIAPPAAPTNLHTVSGKTLFSCDEYIEFAWDASAGATNYWCYMWKDGVELYGTDMGNVLSFLSAPTSAGNYTFIVRASNSFGFSDSSAFVHFSVYDSAPAAPTNLHTVSGKTLFSCDEYIEFAWNASETATTYWVYMWKDGVELYGTEVGNCLCFTSAPTSAGNYTLVVRAGNGFGFSNDPASSVTFRVYDSPPTAPTNVHTVSGRTSFSCDEYIDFAWNASETATTYWVYMWKDGVQLYGTEVGNRLCFTSAPTSAGNYTLVVRAGNEFGFSNDPAFVTFRVYDTPTAFTPGDVDSNGTVTISDALLALRMAMGIIPVANLEAADMNGDGTVSVTDALSIMRVSLGTA